MSRNIWIVLAASLALAGCDAISPTESQYDDSRNPFVKSAEQAVQANDIPKAVASYEQALGANPKLAEVHYKLGHIYADKLSDPIGAIFHFQQYVVLVPSGEKTSEAKTLIEKESQVFVASQPNSPTQAADDYAKLQADNASLKKQLQEATASIVQLKGSYNEVVTKLEQASTVKPSAPADAAASTAAPTVAADGTTTNAAPSGPQKALPLDSTNFLANATAPVPEAPPGPSRSYTVVKGDSIWKIAHKMYKNDTKNGVDKINDANKQILQGKPLKIGQVLVIPD